MIYGAGEYSFKLVDEWAKLPEGESFLDVCGAFIDNRDRVHILNRSASPVMIFDREGSLLSSWGEGFFDQTHGGCIGADGSIFCTDVSHTVTKFDAEGSALMQLGVKNHPSDTGYRPLPDFFESLASIKRGGPPFNRPTDVALSSSGDIYVSDGYGNARVHKFGPRGELLFSWGEPGPGPGQFRLPHSIWVDKIDRVWVTDRENSRIQIFNDQGEFLSQLTDLIRPTDLFIDDDAIYVSELCRRISIFTMDGELLSRWGNERHDIREPLFVAPHAIAVDSRGDLYVGEVSLTYARVDRGPRTIQKFERI